MSRETKVNDGGPAFPVQERVRETGAIGNGQQVERPGPTGMTLRDYFAAAALNGLLSNPNAMDTEEESPTPRELQEVYAFLSYAHADAMLLMRSLEIEPATAAEANANG